MYNFFINVLDMFMLLYLINYFCIKDNSYKIFFRDIGVI